MGKSDDKETKEAQLDTAQLRRMAGTGRHGSPGGQRFQSFWGGKLVNLVPVRERGSMISIGTCRVPVPG